MAAGDSPAAEADDGASCWHPGGQEDLLEGLTREPDAGYGPKWRAGVLQRGGAVDIDVYLAHSDVWSFAPTLRRYREVGRRGVARVGEAFGRRARAALQGCAAPAVLCVEKPYLDGFVEGFGTSASVPFVLLAVNGGDEPFTREQQRRIASLGGLRACFGNNMHAPDDGGLFRPIPIGLAGDTIISRISHSALPWEQRDPRLLVPPMRSSNRLRALYSEVLSRPEYAAMVRIVTGRLGLEEFLVLLSQHRSVLSPPGRGYDCCRTWQAVALGSVPLVVEDPDFDQRLHSLAGPDYIPLPRELSPEVLQRLLSRLQDPAEYVPMVNIDYWKAAWAEILQ